MSARGRHASARVAIAPDPSYYVGKVALRRDGTVGVVTRVDRDGWFWLDDNLDEATLESELRVFWHWDTVTTVRDAVTFMGIVGHRAEEICNQIMFLQNDSARKDSARKGESDVTEANKNHVHPSAQKGLAQQKQDTAPKASAPKASAPKASAPKASAPKASAPKADAPKADAPKVAKADAPAENAKASSPALPADDVKKAHVKDVSEHARVSALESRLEFKMRRIEALEAELEEAGGALMAQSVEVAKLVAEQGALVRELDAMQKRAESAEREFADLAQIAKQVTVKSMVQVASGGRNAPDVEYKNLCLRLAESALAVARHEREGWTVVKFDHLVLDGVVKQVTVLKRFKPAPVDDGISNKAMLDAMHEAVKGFDEPRTPSLSPTGGEEAPHPQPFPPDGGREEEAPAPVPVMGRIGQMIAERGVDAALGVLNDELMQKAKAAYDATLARHADVYVPARTLSASPFADLLEAEQGQPVDVIVLEKN